VPWQHTLARSRQASSPGKLKLKNKVAGVLPGKFLTVVEQEILTLASVFASIVMI
jgi:hypothetical protein